MTREEFREWFAYHCARFTGIRLWLAKITKGEAAPSEEEILRAWYAVLRNVDLETAKAATDRVYAGDVEEPRSFDRHPAAVRKACGLSRASRSRDRPHYDAAGNQTYACPVCRDDGWVLCWHLATVAQIVASGELPGRLYSCVLPCTCKAGDLRARCFPLSPRFDPNRAFPLSGCLSDRDEQRRLLHWLENRQPVRPADFEPAVADPSGSQTEMEF